MPEKTCSCLLYTSAKEHDVHSIAFPAIATGVYGYPLEDATAIAVKTVAQWLEDCLLYTANREKNGSGAADSAQQETAKSRGNKTEWNKTEMCIRDRPTDDQILLETALCRLAMAGSGR